MVVNLLRCKPVGFPHTKLHWGSHKGRHGLCSYGGVFSKSLCLPALSQQAHLTRYMALSNTRAYQGEEGLWFRDGTSYIRIQKIMYGEIPQGIDIFEFDQGGEFEESIFMPKKQKLRIS